MTISINKRNILYYLFAVMPLVDTFNGYLIQCTSFSITSLGQIYRFVVLLVLVWLAINVRFEVKSFFSMLAFSYGLIVMATIHLFAGFSASTNKELSGTIQWIFTAAVIWSMVTITSAGKFSREIVDDILNTYAWLLPLTILIPYVLGIGFSTYSGDIGYKGFYYATNGVSLLSAVLSIYVLYNLYIKFSLVNCVKTGLVFICAILLGTKSAVFSIVLAFVFLLWLAFLRDFTKGIKALAWVAVIGGISLLLFNTFFSSNLKDFMNRVNYIVRVYNNNTVNALTSGRLIKAANIWSTFNQGEVISLITKVFIGSGFIGVISEMDLLDLFFEFGIIGAILFMGFFFSLKKQLNLKLDSIYGVIFWFIVAYSFAVGHIFTNALSSMTFALIICALENQSYKLNV